MRDVDHGLIPPSQFLAATECGALQPPHRGSTTSQRRKLPRLLLAVASVATTAYTSAQGIYPGDLSKEGYKLPGGFEPVLHLRTYDFDQENNSGGQSAAWAIGGWAGMRSPWWGDLFQAGIVGYTSQKLYGPADKDGTKLLAPGQEQITVLGEAFGAVRIAGQTIAGYRQLINRPFINPQDTRMVPNTFEAYTLTGTADQFLTRAVTSPRSRSAIPTASPGCPTPREAPASRKAPSTRAERGTSPRTVTCEWTRCIPPMS